MKHHPITPWGPVTIILLCLAVAAPAAGKYTLAYWREPAAHENQAPPEGPFGNHSAFLQVWDESGQPLPDKRLYTSAGALLGITDANGFAEVELRGPDAYDFQIRDGSHLSDTAPFFTVQRAPNWGHYSIELGFMFKADAGNPGVFDTRYIGTLNSSGSEPCANLSAPYTRSLAYYSTAGAGYCTDHYELGNWNDSHGQTFVATGNRIIAMKALMAAGFLVTYHWTVQILEGGPDGPPVGPPRSTRQLLDSEYYPILLKWGVNDVQVVPGRTYYFKIAREEGLNVHRVNRDNYPSGNYYENGVSVPGAELMGMVLCANYTNAGPTGTLAGSVRGLNDAPLHGARVSVTEVELYATTDSSGNYSLPLIPTGTYAVNVSFPGFGSAVELGVVISPGATRTADFQLGPPPEGDGVILTPEYSLQPFEVSPSWDSTFDAPWGGGLAVDLAISGQAGNALRLVRGGAGSSVLAQVFPLDVNTDYQIAVWGKVPASPSDYWSSAGYRLARNDAGDYDENSEDWTEIQGFSDNGPNGNGNVWTRYTASFNSASATEITVGFKLGALTGSGPISQWDQLSIVSLVVPEVATAVASSPSNIVVRFSRPVALSAAVPHHYRLTAPGEVPAVLDGELMDEFSVLLATTPLKAGVDYDLEVNDVGGANQPAGLTGLNGVADVRVALPLIPLDGVTEWRYNDSGDDLRGSWRSVAFNDSGWNQGPGLLGYSSDFLPEPIRTALSPSLTRVTVYFRKGFLIPPSVTDPVLRLRTVVDDGAVFWINGLQLHRMGAPNPAFYNSLATRNVGVADVEGPFDIVGTRLSEGANVLAVEVHEVDPSSPDVVFGASLEALVLPSQMPMPDLELLLEWQGEDLRLSWDAPGAVLEWAPAVGGPWTDQTGLLSPLTFVPTNTASFFRLKR